MGALTALLNGSVSALMADQAALNATSTNVANQNTIGYTREVASFQSVDAVTLSSAGATADGVNATVSSVRDRVLEQRLQQQTATQGQSSAVESAMQQIENVFSLSSTSTSASSTALGSAMDGFFSSLTALTGDPSSTSVRQGVLAAAGTLASAFNSAASQLGQVQAGLNQQVGSLSAQVNTLTSTIAGLNGRIASAGGTGDSGVLEDQRQAALGQLSQLVGVNQIKTERNGLTLTTTNGAVLVSGAQAFSLNTAVVAGSTHLFDSSNGADITAGVSGGQLGGALQVRDQRLPQYTNALDTLAQNLAASVNTQNAAGLDGAGNPGGAIFGIPAGVPGSAGGISVVATDPQAVAAAGVGEGSLGTTNAAALASLSAQAIVSGQTPGAYLGGLMTGIGSDASAATEDNTAQQAVLTQLTTQRNSLSGVSLDQEAANLTQYQRSYEAAAKVFSIVDSLMAAAMNLGQPTTVS